MKVSLNWLKQYVPVEVSPEEYESRMVMSGTGVESVEALSGDLSGVVVGKVLTCEDHPDSDHLHICTVDVGSGEILQIVCGAPNVQAGILVPVALIGAQLPGGLKIKKGRLRGVESCGMLCSGTELNVPEYLYPSVGAAGLLIFNEDHPLGQDVKEIFGLNDTVVDFEILANRPDCLSVWGVARETAAALNAPLRLPEVKVKETEGDMSSLVSIRVEDEALCPHYAAKVIDNVRIAPSPMWLREYLHACGVRSINNIVDITNFVMLETGHPMHAFDLDRVRGREIHVRPSREGETLVTLDEKSYALTGRELTICDREKPTGLAGIMGGEESEITENTRQVLFECAAFDRTSIRLTARRLGIRTEASGRFERGVSPATVMTALLRACQMVNELDAGDVLSGVYDYYPHPIEPAQVNVSVDYINKRTGISLSGEEMKKILEKLFFKVALQDDVLQVTAPEFRQDIEQEADIAEEVLRMAGYDLIPSTNLKGEISSGGYNEETRRRMILRELLGGMGFYACMNYSFISQKSIEMLNLPESDPRLRPLNILNPLGEDTACMRPTLLPGVLKTVSLNQRGGSGKGRLYEIGHIFSPDEKTEEGLPVERDTLTFAVWGEDESFYTLRECAEIILRKLGIDYRVKLTAESCLHPGQRAVLTAGEKFDAVLCTMGQIHPDVAENYELSAKTYVVSLDIETLFSFAQPTDKVQPVSRTPAVSRDLALVVDLFTPLGPLEQAMKDACGEKLEEIALFDVFTGLQVGAGKKSAAFTLTFRAKDHTLTEDEINALVSRALKAAETGFGAALR